MVDITLSGSPAYGGGLWGLKQGTDSTMQPLQSEDGVLLVRDVSGSSGGGISGLTPIATATAQSSLVLKAGAGKFYGANVTSSTAGYLMLFDAASAPADGVVTPQKVWAIGAGGSFVMGCEIPLVMTVGITLVFSSTGPFQKTEAPCFMSGEAI